ncbi:MAG: metal ABC transporter ATP-binding protein [Acidimicrobiia bacterium]|nr:metal ABC transporter ATP-binding protein [Acidimicrobiia bacterium]MDH5519430.1 metal ABC transporter ATP-binding protein [Acidimicrobiia bacterium]
MRRRGTATIDRRLSSPIELAGATVAFGSRIAVDHIDFRLAAGDSVAVVGPNGSGKTTMLRLVAGLIEPTSGTVSRPSDATFGYVSQHASHPAWLPLTVADVIRMGRYGDRGLLGRFTAADRSIMGEAAERLGVDDLMGQAYGELSGGQRQRVRIAQALAMAPDVLILDEPITGLDLPSQQVILDLIEGQAVRGTAVMLTTHHLDEARHCSRVVLLAGRIVANGPPDQVLRPDNLRATFGDRLLGDHRNHDHPQDMMVVDNHGHDDRHGH